MSDGGWAKSTVTQLAAYIATREPGLRGFSPQNLWRMRQFFEAYREYPKLSPALRVLPWSSHLHILSRTKRPEEREFYLRMTARNRWPVREVARQIDAGLFERTVLDRPKLSTVLRVLHPEADSHFKDAYLLEFLGLPTAHSEADLHRSLLQNLGRFLTELGRDFCYIGSEYPVQVGAQDFARSEITTILQKEFSMLSSVFGTLEVGTPDNPSVTKESIHHFYKYVSGNILTRPAWFMDVTQQGEGIVDVTTHLVDLVQWECFPEQTLDYSKDIQIINATRTTTEMTLSEFKAITKLEGFPDYLKKDIVNDSILKIYSNGEINYKLKNVHAKVSVIWNYKAPEGTGDTHYSIMRGTNANLIIKQGAEQQYKPTLYIQPIAADGSFERVLIEQLKQIQSKYPGIELKKLDKDWEVIIPESYKEGHEAHFGRVMQRFLEYLQNKNMPEWEVSNMLAKYYTTTQALELAKKK